MSFDPYAKRLFEMRLEDIYNKYSWLKNEISLKEFVKLFPVVYKNNRPAEMIRPQEFDLDRDIFLEVLVAYKQSFR
jgi:hypothetical protein